MIILGVLLILLAVVAGLLLFTGIGSLTDTIDFQVLGGTLSLPPVVLLVTGMVIITLFWFGWFLLRVGTTRAHRRRVAAKEAAREAEERRKADEARMKDEVEARERQLAEERRRHEEREEALRREAEARVAEQHVSTETARRRAEAAEARAGDRPAAETIVERGRGGTVPPPPPPAHS